MEKGFSHTENDLSKAEIGISRVWAMRKKLDARKWQQECQLESDLKGNCVQDYEVVFYLWSHHNSPKDFKWKSETLRFRNDPGALWVRRSWAWIWREWLLYSSRRDLIKVWGKAIPVRMGLGKTGKSWVRKSQQVHSQIPHEKTERPSWLPYEWWWAVICPNLLINTSLSMWFFFSWNRNKNVSFIYQHWLILY